MRRQPPMPPTNSTSDCSTSMPPRGDEVARLVLVPHHLAGSDPHAGQPPQRGVAVDVVGSAAAPPASRRPAARARGPRAPPSATSQRGSRSPGIRQPWLASTISSSRRRRPPHLRDDLHVLAPVGVVEADLECAHAGVARARRPAGALGGVDQLAARGVREMRSLRPPSSRQTGLSSRRRRGPSRPLDRPGPAAMEVDRLADLAHRFGAARVEADEEMLEQLAVGQAVAARRYPVMPASVRTSTSVASRACAGPGPRPPGRADRAGSGSPRLARTRSSAHQVPAVEGVGGGLARVGDLAHPPAGRAGQGVADRHSASRRGSPADRRLVAGRRDRPRRPPADHSPA